MSEDEQISNTAGVPETAIPTRWSQVRNSVQRRQLLEQYVDRSCEKVGLVSQNDKQNALNTLLLGFCLGAFSTVTMQSDGTIDTVDGFDYSPETKKFTFKKPTPRIRKAVTTDTVCDEQHITTDATWIKPWVKLLRTIMRIPDDASLSSAIPSVTEESFVFQRAR
jgi:hypothetical protein